MKTIQVRAKLLSEEGNGLANKKVAVESFDLDKNTWRAIANVVSNRIGAVSVNVAFGQNIQQAPNLRLIEAGGSPTRVLAQHCYMNYVKRSQVLTCDFGEVEYLDDSAFKVAPVLSSFQKDKTVLSGQVRRPDVSALSAIRSALLTARSGAVVSDAVVSARLPEELVSTGANANAVSGVTLDAFNAEVLKLTVAQAALKDTIRLRDLDLQAKQKALDSSVAETANLKLSVKNLQDNEKQLKSSIKSLEEKNLVFTNEEKRLSPIDSVASNIGAQLDKANKKMRSDAQPYRIQNIALELNGSISQDGKSIALARLSDSKEGLQGAQKLKIDLVAANSVSSATGVLVPDVSGFTESMVRRLLKSIGLKLEALDQTVSEGSGYTPGQLILQSPKAGSELPVSGTVIGVFAKV